MSNMFCFQCQQTAGGSACINTGVCGKQPSTSNLQDELVCELIKLAELSKNENKHSAVADRLIIDGLFTTLTNVNFDDNAIKEFMGRVKNEQNKISRPEAEKIQVITAQYKKLSGAMFLPNMTASTSTVTIIKRWSRIPNPEPNRIPAIVRMIFSRRTY